MKGYNVSYDTALCASSTSIMLRIDANSKVTVLYYFFRLLPTVTEFLAFMCYQRIKAKSGAYLPNLFIKLLFVKGFSLHVNQRLKRITPSRAWDGIWNIYWNFTFMINFNVYSWVFGGNINDVMEILFIIQLAQSLMYMVVFSSRCIINYWIVWLW